MSCFPHKVKAAITWIVPRLAVVLVAGPCASLFTFAQEPEQELIRMRLAALPRQPLVDNILVADGRVLAAIYEQRAFRPAWSERARAEAFVSLVARAEEEGLDPADYHWPQLARMLSQTGESLDADLERVDRDLLLTDSLLRYAYHLRFGKADPARLYPEWNLSRALPDSDTLTRLQAVIDSQDPQQALAEAIPQTPYYGHLKQALQRYRTIRDRGGGPAIPAGPPLKLGMTGARVSMLRERLRTTGSHQFAQGENSAHFDDELERAVIAFQMNHGLAADGIVGAETLSALNISASARIDQLRVNMERARWFFQDTKEDYLLVNIAAFKAWLIRSGTQVWSGRTVVGKPFRKTPVFKSKITYLVFNPTWTVPPTILREDLLPLVKRDPGYLSRQSMKIFDRYGNIVDPHSIDWASVDPQSFPHTIRQDPGTNNAMGRVKIMLPNPYFVYLHDTPSKELFERADRSFSSGCIRVENISALVELLLGDSHDWDARAIAGVIDSGRTRSAPLTHPMTILVLYRTNEVDAAGNVYFLNDVYHRDPAVLEALAGPFVFSPPAGFDDQFSNIH